MRDIMNQISQGIVIFNEAFTKIIYANKLAVKVLFNKESPMIELIDRQLQEKVHERDFMKERRES